MSSLEQKLQNKLTKRLDDNSLRTLKYSPALIDFCSNDYLGFSRSPELRSNIREIENTFETHQHGATSSRLIAGHHPFFDKTEALIAKCHQAEAALLFNSGYAANLSVLSCLPQRGDTVFYDELSHACIKDGIRLSMANRYSFKHNDLIDLEKKLKNASGTIFIVVESIYSMDGDEAPLALLAELTNKYDANLIVDEAHSTGTIGINGEGLVNALGLSKQIFCRIHTFGKAMGCHGAAVVGSLVLKQYLINFARPFIFTTAMPLNNVASIYASYLYLNSNLHLLQLLQDNVQLFKNSLNSNKLQTISSYSAIQVVLFPGNEVALSAAKAIQNQGFDVRAILSPTVKVGEERLRICIHSFNAQNDIINLAKVINNLLN